MKGSSQINREFKMETTISRSKNICTYGDLTLMVSDPYGSDPYGSDPYGKPLMAT